MVTEIKQFDSLLLTYYYFTVALVQILLSYSHESLKILLEKNLLEGTDLKQDQFCGVQVPVKGTLSSNNSLRRCHLFRCYYFIYYTKITYFVTNISSLNSFYQLFLVALY